MSDALIEMQAQIHKLQVELERLRRGTTLSQQLYASGTWTPIFAGTGTIGAFTYSAQEGVYTRLGALVYVRGRLTITAITTPPTGSMQIRTLPFTCEATHYHPINFGFISNFNYTNTAFELTALVIASSTGIQLYESFDNAVVVAVPAANFVNAACDLIFSGLYRV